MALNEGFKQGLLMDGEVQNIIPTVAALNYYSGWAFLHNLVDGDVIEFVIYVYDPESAVQRVYDRFTVRGVQIRPSSFAPPNVPTAEFRVTAEQTASGAGGFKTVNVVRYDN